MSCQITNISIHNKQNISSYVDENMMYNYNYNYNYNTTNFNVSLYSPSSVIIDNSGNLYISTNNGIIKVTTKGVISNYIPYITSVNTNGIVIDNNNNFYIASGSLILKVDTKGVVSTYAGTNNLTISYFKSGDGGPATSARLGYPTGLAIDSSGNLYFCDQSVIRMVNTKGIISTYAGTNTTSYIGNRIPGYGYSGDGGLATKAKLKNPHGLAIDSSDNLYIADTGNHVIRKIDSSSRIITTYAGTGVVGTTTTTTTITTGVSGYSGDGGLATKAKLKNPHGLAIDSSDNLYIADTGNDVIRKIDSSGIITTYAGTGVAGYSGDGGLATKADLNRPIGLAIDNGDNLYIADTYNNAIRKVSNFIVCFDKGGKNECHTVDKVVGGVGGVETYIKDTMSTRTTRTNTLIFIIILMIIVVMVVLLIRK